jgi:hypothetical protein
LHGDNQLPIRFTPLNGTTEELIPAPFVSITKSLVKDKAGNVLHPIYNIALTGTIVNVGQSVDSPYMTNSILGDMDDILGEISRIRNLFNTSSGRLEIEAPNGGGPNTMDIYCSVDSIDIAPSTWTVRADYTIVLTATKVEDEDDPDGLSQTNETWGFQENINGTVSIAHNLSATSIPIYGIGGIINDPLQLSKNWCYDRSVVLSTVGNLSYYNLPSGNIDLSTLLVNVGNGSGNFWNKSLRESSNLTEFGWELEESFLYDPNGVAIEEYKMSLNRDSEDLRKNTVNINGVITGNADTFDNLSLRNSRAKTYFDVSVAPNLYTRISSYLESGFSTNPIPTTKQISYNIDQGTLEYSYTYIATSGFLFDNTIDENITIIDTAPTDIFAQIQIPGKASGPLFQNMSTVTAPERAVNINILFMPSSSGLSTSSILGMYLSKPNTDAIISQLVPNNGYYYIRSNTEEWNPLKRQYSRSVSWVIDNQGLSVAGIPTTINNTDV